MIDSTGTAGGPWRNAVVAVDSLPAVDDAPFEPLEPRYLRQQRTIWCTIVAVLLAAAVTVFVLVDPPALVWVAVPALLAIAGLAWVLEGMAFSHRGVQLRERDVSTRRGLISRTTTSVPFTRVQHVTVERGLLDRMFGLAQVVIFTAGAISADARVKGLTPDRADRLREDIINRSSELDPDVGAETNIDDPSEVERHADT